MSKSTAAISESRRQIVHRTRGLGSCTGSLAQGQVLNFDDGFFELAIARARTSDKFCRCCC